MTASPKQSFPIRFKVPQSTRSESLENLPFLTSFGKIKKMDETKAKSNLCRIVCRRNNDEKTSVFGCGCVVKCSEQSLKIATSKKILKELTSGGKVFAIFEAIQDKPAEEPKKFEIQVDVVEEAGEESGIAYLSFDEAAFEHRPEGILMGDVSRIGEIACRVPLFEKLEQFGVTNETVVEYYNVVNDKTICTLQIQAGNNKRVIKRLSDSENFHLLVRGAPIFDAERFEFFGIVDFVEVDKKFLLKLVYRGIQVKVRCKQPTGHQETLGPDPAEQAEGEAGGSSQEQQITAQETICEAELKKLSTADKLADLWEISIDFRDEFSKVLDVKYSEIKYWPHLAEKFGIDKIIYDAFSTSDINSPTETLLSYLEAKEPLLSIKELCKSLDMGDAQEVCRIVEDSIKAGVLCQDDLVTDMCDKAPTVLDKIILKLDREDRLWRDLARARKIPQKKFSTFNSDRSRADNPTRLLLDALKTERPDLSIKNFKEKLIKLNKNNLVEILNKFNIPDGMLLRDLSEHPDAKTEIETKLNDLKTDDLWKLASLYKKEGLMKDIKIEQIFRQGEKCHSPTSRMMEYVLSSQAQRYTIEDLVIKLKAIKREDCVLIIEPYLKGGKDDIDKITARLRNLQGEQSDEGNMPSCGEERTSPSIPVSEVESDELQNQFVMCYTGN